MSYLDAWGFPCQASLEKYNCVFHKAAQTKVKINKTFLKCLPTYVKHTCENMVLRGDGRQSKH